MPKGSIRITKRQFYDEGSFANSSLWRRTDSLGRWQHFKRID